MATNEELVLRIQAGERELMSELWEQVEQFICYMANRRLRKLPCGIAEFEDLYQSGYIAFLKAVEGFEGAAEANFTTYLTLALKTSFAEATGYRTRKQQNDPLKAALSFDTPIADGLCLGDTLTDDSAVEAFEDAERRVFIVQLKREIELALSKLTEDQNAAIKERFYMQYPLKKMAEKRGVSVEWARQIVNQALKRLRKPQIGKSLEKFAFPDGGRRIDRRTNFYHHVGLNRFKSTGASSVEEIAEWREELYRRLGL